MDQIFDFLRAYVPATSLFLGLAFVSFLILFKRIGDRFVKIAERQTQLADAQTTYLKDRLEAADRLFGIADKAHSLKDRHIDDLEATLSRREAELGDSQARLQRAELRVGELDESLHLTVAQLGIQAEERKHLKAIQENLAEATMERFVARFAHDLGSELIAVNLRAEYLAMSMEAAATEQTPSDITKLVSATRRALNTIRNFIIAPQLRQVELVDVRDLTDRAVATYADIALVRGVGIEVSVDTEEADVPRVKGDRSQLSLMLSNLVNNAVLYSFPDTRIDIEILAKENGCEIAIANIGLRISDEDLNSGEIFKDGYRGEEAQLTTAHGSGRGLFVAREIIQAHGGQITISSERSDAGSASYLTTVNVRLLKEPRPQGRQS